MQLNRFLEAQNLVYKDVVSELERGLKTTHWMWYMFPQYKGLGKSSISVKYSIYSIKEAQDYIRHEVLGTRLISISEILLKHKNTLSAKEIFGSVDSMKLKSCMTLFAKTQKKYTIFDTIINNFFGGEYDNLTIKLLAKNLVNSVIELEEYIKEYSMFDPRWLRGGLDRDSLIISNQFRGIFSEKKVKEVITDLLNNDWKKDNPQLDRHFIIYPRDLEVNERPKIKYADCSVIFELFVEINNLIFYGEAAYVEMLVKEVQKYFIETDMDRLFSFAESNKDPVFILLVKGSDLYLFKSNFRPEIGDFCTKVERYNEWDISSYHSSSDWTDHFFYCL